MALKPLARALLAVCTLVLLLPLSAVAQRRVYTGAPPLQWSGFTRAFDDYAVADGVVGGGAVIVRDGRIVVEVIPHPERSEGPTNPPSRSGE